MNRHPISRHAPPFHMTAVALSILLAACGGGGDGNSNRAVSSSPIPNTQSNNGTGSSLTTNINVTTGAFAGSGAIAEAINSGTRPGGTVPAPDDGSTANTKPPASGNDSSSQNPPASSGNNNQPSVNTAPNTGAGTPPTTGNPRNDANGNGTAVAEPTKPATPAVVPLVSDAGVQGEVVLAMMDQRQCTWDYRGQGYDRNGGGYTAPLGVVASLDWDSYTYDLSVWERHGSRAPIGLAPEHVIQCHYPEIRSYTKPVPPGTHNFRMSTWPGYVPHRSSRYYGLVTKGINHAHTNYKITIGEKQFSIGPKVSFEQREDFKYLADSSGQGAPEGRSLETELSGLQRSFSRQELLPFGPLGQWSDSNGNYVQLLLIKADEPNTIRLCTHLNAVLVKRLHCVTWEVPADWTWGKELLGGEHYMIDDRTVYQDETGFLYFGRTPVKE